MCPSRNWLSLGTRSFTPPSTSLARGELMLTTDMEAMVLWSQRLNLLTLASLLLRALELLCPTSLLSRKRLPLRDQPTLLICPSRNWLLLGMK